MRARTLELNRCRPECLPSDLNAEGYCIKCDSSWHLPLARSIRDIKQADMATLVRHAKAFSIAERRVAEWKAAVAHYAAARDAWRRVGRSEELETKAIEAGYAVDRILRETLNELARLVQP